MIFAHSFSERSAMAVRLQLPRKKAPNPTDRHVGSRVRMRRSPAALGFALLSGNALAQTLTSLPPSTGVSPGLPPLQSQIQPPLPPTGTAIVQPIPLTPPQLPVATTAFTACSMACDTLAMNCQNSCVPITGAAAANPAAPAGVTSSCNLSCATQQLVCKQSCGPGQ
jgi:hypothetical protein